MEQEITNMDKKKTKHGIGERKKHRVEECNTSRRRKQNIQQDIGKHEVGDIKTWSKRFKKNMKYKITKYGVEDNKTCCR